MRIVAGLGNPGSRYAGNRHNIGFMALEALARRWRFGPWREKFHARIADGLVGDERVLALAPLTYMNESGQAIAAAMRFYKLTPADVIVIHDELELPPGKMRVKTGGGAAGHNGLKSIDAHIGPAYHRVRLGIGHPGVKHLVHDYVLQDFPKADEPWVESMVTAVADAMPSLVGGDANGFMNKVTLTLHPPPPRRAPETAAPEK